MSVLRRFKRYVSDNVNGFKYSYGRLTRTQKISFDENSKRKISVAITHYNNSELVHYSWFNLLSHPNVEEIIVLDDGSGQKEFDLLIKKATPFKKKIKVYRRDKNWKALANKVQAVSLCKNDWVLLLDCDNTYHEESLSVLFEMDEWDSKCIYCPDFAFPHYDFRDLFDQEYIGVTEVNKAKSSFKGLMTFLNNGNYFLNRDEFLLLMRPIIPLIAYASEVALMNFYWMANGNKLRILSGLNYYHRVYGWSTYDKNSSHSEKEIDRLERLFKQSSFDELLLDKLKKEYPTQEIHWHDPKQYL